MEPLLTAIAAAQCGVFSRVQALTAGYTDRRIRHLLAIGTWLRTQIRQQPEWVVATVLERVRQLSSN
jgi:hypothetical protein